MVAWGWPEQWIRTLGKRVLELDVKEHSRAKRDGEGDFGGAAVVAALDAIGYAGWATAEVGGGDQARLSDVAARMRRVLQG